MKWLIGIAIILMSAVVAISLPFKQKTTLTWEAPTTNVDGSPITDLGGYKLYFSQVSGAYTDADSRDVGNVLSAHIPTIIGVLNGNYCFVVTAYDTSGNESDFSNEYCDRQVNKKRPPTNLGAQ